jgi:3'-5' exoribonuclease
MEVRELTDGPEQECVSGPPRDPAQMEADLRSLLATVQCPHLRALLDAVFGADGETWRRFRDAPAAKRYHQAYRHGLLEHSLTVAQSVSAISATFPGIERDVAVCGALLHDIGKLDAYTAGPAAIEMTDAGKLQGEISLGYYRVRRLIEDQPGFPDELAQAVLHIILSHHGALEHGSPVVPCTREATLVHMIDNLGGRLGSFDRLERELPDGSGWSAYDRALGGGAYFAARKAA